MPRQNRVPPNSFGFKRNHADSLTQFTAVLAKIDIELQKERETSRDMAHQCFMAI